MVAILYWKNMGQEEQTRIQCWERYPRCQRKGRTCVTWFSCVYRYASTRQTKRRENKKTGDANALVQCVLHLKRPDAGQPVRHTAGPVLVAPVGENNQQQQLMIDRHASTKKKEKVHRETTTNFLTFSLSKIKFKCFFTFTFYFSGWIRFYK